MKIHYRHIDGTDIIESTLPKRRSHYFLEIPILGEQDSWHVHGSGKIAFCLPLFLPSKLDHKGDENIKMRVCGFIKRAFWLAAELSKHSGLVETESSIYILVDEKIQEIVEPYRARCNFPSGNMIVTPVEDWGYMPKIELLRYLCHQTNHEFYMSMDTSVHFPVDIPFCQELNKYWEQFPDHLILAHDPCLDYFVDKVTDSEKDHSYAFLTWLSTTGIDPNQFYTVFPKFRYNFDYEALYKFASYPVVSVSGWFYGLSRSVILSEDFEDLFQFCRKHRCLGQDECFLFFYWHYFLSPIREVFARPEIVRKIKLGCDFAEKQPQKDSFFFFNNGSAHKQIFTNYYKEYYK